MYYGEAKTPEAEDLRDAFPHVGCGLCKFFNVRADMPDVKGTCKRLDHKNIKFAVPWFKCYDCGQQSGVMCRDFAPAEWVKYLHRHWCGVEEYVGEIPEKAELGLTIGGDTSVRYVVRLKEFFDGTFVDDGTLRCYGKTFYVKRNNKEKYPIGYELINERYEQPVLIDIGYVTN